MDVSIIIVNYNTCVLTRNCLKSVFEQTKDVDYEIIVSDNGSKDGSIEMIKAEFPQVILIENNENLGFGAANNRGSEISKGKYLFLLNSDTLLLNNAIKKFFDYMERLPETEACCGTILENGDGEEIHSYGDFHTLLNCLDEWVWYGIRHKLFRNSKLKKYDNPKYKYGQSYRVQFVTGADLFVRKSVVDKLGLFDTDFFMYSEDMELQYRYFKNGYYSSIISGAKIAHLIGGSNKKKPLAKNEMVLGSLFLYKKKELSKLGYFFFKLFFKMFYCPKVLLISFPIKEKINHISNVVSLNP